MADLTAIAESRSWPELIEHAEDVRPTERGPEWRQLLVQSATEYIDNLLSQRKPRDALAAAKRMGARFGLLADIPAFTAKRHEAGLATYATCPEDAACVEALLTFLAIEGHPPALARAAGKLMVEEGLWRAPAAPVFAYAVAADRATCSDPSLAESVLAAITRPPDGRDALAAATIAFDHCYQTLEHALWRLFYNSYYNYDVTHLCEGFVRMGSRLTELQTAFCHDKLAGDSQAVKGEHEPCGTKLKVTVDWASFGETPQGVQEQPISSYCDYMLEAMADMCKRPSMRAYISKTVKQLNCHGMNGSPEWAVKVKDGTIEWYSSRSGANAVAFATAELLRQL